MSFQISQKEINALAFPAMVAGLAEPLISLADTSIVGHIKEHSTEAIGGIGIATGLFFLLFWTFIVLHPAMVAVVGRYTGMKRERELEPLIFQLIVLNIGLGLALFALSNLFLEPLLRLYQADGLVLEYAMEYFSIRSFGLPLMLVTYLLFGVFQGLQNTRWAMWIALAGGALNLILDLILVYGIEGVIPPLGVRGAAFGALGSQVLMIVITFWIMYRRTEFRIRPSFKAQPEFKSTLGVSGNFMIRTLTINAVLFLSSRMATGIGEHELAAHTMAIQIWTFSFFLLDGYSNAGMALSGRLLGESNAQGLRFLSRRLVVIGLLVAGGLMLLFSSTYFMIGDLLSNNALTVLSFEGVFWVLILSMPLCALAFTYDGLLKGMAKARYLRDMMLVALAGFALAMFTLPEALTTIWWSFIAWMVVRTIWPAWYFHRRLLPELLRN